MLFDRPWVYCVGRDMAIHFLAVRSTSYRDTKKPSYAGLFCVSGKPLVAEYRGVAIAVVIAVTEYLHTDAGAF